MKGIAHNGFSQVLVREEALSDKTDVCWFHAPHAGTLWDGTGHLVAKQESTGGCVPCSTLDVFVKSRGIDRLDLIKIDVEGWELPVLRGSEYSIRRFQPRIIFEFDPAYVSRCGATAAEIVGLLQSLNYELYFLDDRHRLSKLAKLDRKACNLLALPIGRH
jgi:FkbM family methyltransferase